MQALPLAMVWAALGIKSMMVVRVVNNLCDPMMCPRATLVPRTLLWGTAHPRNPCDPTSFHRAD